ncbi:MAG: L-threonylcarbamoyladenylate synthase [Cyanobacteria bacterium P01_A01_bin.123]
MPQVSMSQWVNDVKVGKLASFPTDTVPALAAEPHQGDRIFAFKQRPTTKPLILLAAAWLDLLPYITGTPTEIDQWQTLARQHWPGALTLVLPASDRVPVAINPLQTGTVGVRIPDHPVALALLSQTGALATTSVNRSGQPALLTQAAIEQQFPDLLTLSPAALTALTDAAKTSGQKASGVPSTVIQWIAPRQSWQLIRQGRVILDSALS